MDYSKTLNLPQSKFPMKADLAVREPSFLKFWEGQGIYRRLREKNAKKPKYILHDGPPYSNGRIHLGTALNKIVKDFVVKFKSMNGYDSPYIPGWDTHGLPIELAAIKEHKVDRRLVDPMDLRQKCKKLALHFVDVQREQFKRLGILGDWGHPYLTLDPTYEAAVVRTFGEMALKGYIYRDKKPVYWCYHCETSLAEAEIEYQEKQSPSIFVKFLIEDKYQHIPSITGLMGEDKKIYIVIWTTTPWTLPANVAIALHPDENYQIINNKDEYYIVAEALRNSFLQTTGIKNHQTLSANFKGSELLKIECRHPFLNRSSILITEEYVTMDQGTGCVHTAPGHGADDFEAARHFNLPVLVPVDSHGVFTNEAGPFALLSIDKANPAIVEHLKQNNFLLYSEEITHSYPHCWRCHKPVIFRATDQWFVSMDTNTSGETLRERTSKEIQNIKWFPHWGEERMFNMLQDRPDWCISRQRVWGVPLPVFYCNNCHEPIVCQETIGAVANLFQSEGADAWFVKEANEIVPPGFSCPKCKHNKFTKEQDIFDVWFESGVSHLAVLENREELSWPSNLYLEGPDQYRGWFQVSLLIAMATRGSPPYNEVVTNGWVLDSEGRTMHKSLGNVIDPMDIVNTYGSDLLRLYFASVEFKNDVKIWDNAIKQVGEVYRQIRNTCRFLLGNLDQFEPDTEKLDYEEIKNAPFGELDQWALGRLSLLIENVTNAYNKHDFHLVLANIQHFCVKDMSEFYLDIIKDRLYTYSSQSPGRCSVRTVLHEILSVLVRLLYPILSFTAEEVWQHLPWYSNEAISVALADWPKGDRRWSNSVLLEKWDEILNFRKTVYVEIEELRKQKLVGRSEEVLIELSPAGKFKTTLSEAFLPILKVALKVSEIKICDTGDLINKYTLNQTDYVVFKVKRHPGQKCERCWYYFNTLSGHETHPTLCNRCFDEVTTPISNK